MRTIKVTVEGRDVRFRGKRVHYCPLGLLGTVCESVAIRRASGSPLARAAQDWPNRETGIEQVFAATVAEINADPEIAECFR